VNGDGRQVVRAAYGIYYNRFRANGAPRNERNPTALSVTIPNPSYPDPYQGRDPFELAASSPSFGIMSNTARNPHTHQFSVGYSRQIGPYIGVSADATMAEGRDQHTQIDANYYLTPADRAARRRANPARGLITEGRTDGKLEYRAFELRLDRRMAQRWQMLASYTVASAKNDTEVFPADHFNRGEDFGQVSSSVRLRRCARIRSGRWSKCPDRSSTMRSVWQRRFG
jgi:hypothetical protein